METRKKEQKTIKQARVTNIRQTYLTETVLYV